MLTRCMNSDQAGARDRGCIPSSVDRDKLVGAPAVSGVVLCGKRRASIISGSYKLPKSRRGAYLLPANLRATSARAAENNQEICHCAMR